MNEAERIFARFPGFIKEYAYSRGWSELRDIQIFAAHSVFDTDNDLLLTSSTASGKTEAALFPVITKIHEDMPESISVLYIAPLKALINDQYERVSELLCDSDIPVHRWHGDIGASYKNRVLKSPRGILQITPESLESLLVNRAADIKRLFSDLRFVIIDEIHTLISNDRGNQIICQLCRIADIIGYHPRRIGLSATIGDSEGAGAWLCSGGGRNVDISENTSERLRWRIGIEHFYVNDGAGDGSSFDSVDESYEYLYDCVGGSGALVFANSREQTERNAAMLREICRRRGERDVFYVHHGNISASLRKKAEEEMKREGGLAVTCATVTMELGIDIGMLERVVQVGAPTSVSSFLQRLGRSGRRKGIPEMMMVLREDAPAKSSVLPELIPFELVRAIAIIQLYIEERFIEPQMKKKAPFSLAFQQTLSILSSIGEMSPRQLADRLLSLPSFSHICREDYRQLLISMIKADLIEMTEEGGLIVGLKGEKYTSSFKFYAVFRDSEDYRVRCGTEEIGKISGAVFLGDKFALAGKSWQVSEVDAERRIVFVKTAEGSMGALWSTHSAEIHTRVMSRMRDVLLHDDTVYPYLKEGARRRLIEARALCRNAKMNERSLVYLGGFCYCLFLWVGTRGARAVLGYLNGRAEALGIYDIEYYGCEYITFKIKDNDAAHLVSLIVRDVKNGDFEKIAKKTDKDNLCYDKYDEHIPLSILQKAYEADRISVDETKEVLIRLGDEFFGT